jgi:II/X family phage/plasmid replication protein
MIDTVGVFVPIDDDLFEYLKGVAIKTERTDRMTGDVIFEYYNFEVPAETWNHKILFKIDNRYWTRDPQLKITVLEEGLPYIRFEFSVPKVLFGNNLYSASMEDLITACDLVCNSFRAFFEVDIPYITEWYLNRLDVCANFILENAKQVKAVISDMSDLDYTRRNATIYKNETIYFSSRVNTLKIYAKGPEFKKHDAKRIYEDHKRSALQAIANKIIRCEVELKARIKYICNKLKDDYLTDEKETGNCALEKFQGWPKMLAFLKQVNLREELERMIIKLTNTKQAKAMSSNDVFLLLRNYNERIAASYHSFYVRAVTKGINEARRYTSKSTAWRIREVFRELNISLISSDLERQLDDSEFEKVRKYPADFTFEISDKNKYYQIPGELKFVA